jgi:hypothetical protein
MECPLCRQRAARRACPALGRQICSVCCGTKRLAEIACPPDCGYLAAAQTHPAAVVRRQQQRDLVFMTALMKGLTPRQKDIAWATLGLVSRFNADPLLRLSDEDVADMASSLAATMETASRGVIYEHRPRSVMAQRLSTDVRVFLDQGREQSGAGFDRDATAALMRIGGTFRDAAKLLGGDAPSVCLATITRLMRSAETVPGPQPAGDSPIAAPGPSLIIP